MGTGAGVWTLWCPFEFTIAETWLPFLHLRVKMRRIKNEYRKTGSNYDI